MLYPKVPSGRRTMSKDPKSPNQNEGIEKDKAQDTQRIGNSPAASNAPRLAELHFPVSDLEKGDKEYEAPVNLTAPQGLPEPSHEEEQADEIHDEMPTSDADNMEHLRQGDEESSGASEPISSDSVEGVEHLTVSTNDAPQPEPADDSTNMADSAEPVTPAELRPEANNESGTLEDRQAAPTSSEDEAQSAPQEEFLPTAGEDVSVQAGVPAESRTEATLEGSSVEGDVGPVATEPADFAEPSGIEEAHESLTENVAANTDGADSAKEIEASVENEMSEAAGAALEPLSSISGMVIPPAVVTPGALATGLQDDEDNTEGPAENIESASQENTQDQVSAEDKAEAEEDVGTIGKQESALRPEEGQKAEAPAERIEVEQEAKAEEPPAETEQLLAVGDVAEISDETISTQESLEQQGKVETGEPSTVEGTREVAEEPSPIEENVGQEEQIEQSIPVADVGERTELENIGEVSEGSAPTEADSGEVEQVGQEMSVTEATEPASAGQEEVVSSEETGGDEEPEVREEVVDDLAHIIESIIFASDEPLSVPTIKSVLDAAHTFGRVNPDMITSRVSALNAKYEADGTGFHIVEIANGYQYATRKEMAQWVSNLFKERSKRRLSNSALETVAIIAYKQPITKPEIESIRGVNVDYVLHNLLEKELVTVVGRAETVGRPLLYGTTQKFLKVFALKSLDDLPKLREIEEIIKEIKSKGAEESIQLEITALGDSSSPEPAAGGDIAPKAPSENGAE